MLIDFNTNNYYYSRYFSNFRGNCYTNYYNFPLLAKSRSNNTFVPVKKQLYKLVLAFGIFFLVFYLLFVKSFAIAYDASAVMLWAGAVFILSRHTTRLSLKDNLKQQYLSNYKPFYPKPL